MTYIKKMCILRQVKQGFSGDGKTLSGLVKVEQYGNNLAVEVSVINFAPLVSGEYYCILADCNGKTETLALRGKSLFNLLTDLDVSGGFCAVVCFVKNEIVPVAYGVNGNTHYDWNRILGATLPPTFSKNTQETAVTRSNTTTNNDDGKEIDSAVEANDLGDEKEESQVVEERKSAKYDDETVATENYYKEQEDESNELAKGGDNAVAENPTEKQDEKTRTDAPQDADDESVLHPFTTDGDGYYRSVKSEIDELFERFPKDDSLKGAFSCSEWVRVKGEESAPEYLVGVIYDDGKAKYICYALKAENKDAPPKEIKEACSFVPATVFNDSEGYFVIFQSATTGECIKPERV